MCRCPTTWRRLKAQVRVFGSANATNVSLTTTREYLGEGIDPEVEALTRAAVDMLAAEGVEVVDISLPHTEYAIPAYYLLATAEASANLERFDGVRYGHRTADPANLFELYARFCVRLCL